MSDIAVKAQLEYMVKEGSERHKYYVNKYNSTTPLPVGYKCTYTDSWCALFVSWLGYEYGFNILPECGAHRQMQLYKNASRFTKDNPQVGDLVFYDWQKTGDWVDHVEIVTSVEDNKIISIGGNVSDRVGFHTYELDSPFIVGYGINTVDSDITTDDDTGTGTLLELDEIAKQVIKGIWGNGETRKSMLTSAGYDYVAVQTRVNELLKGA